MFKTGLILGTFFSLLTVVLGAFGAHALKEQLTEYGQSIYDKAVFYQMFHAIGIFIVTIIGNYYSSFNISIIVWAFVLGILLFSGSLYILAVTKIKWLGMITPLGGTFFIIGWGMLIYKLLKI
tara:strand:+ start:425 stop:793 length:369 start_codon:yes stop_codon:yes gene_type:complete